MDIKPETNSRLADELHEHGMRVTTEREAVYNVLKSRKGRPMEAQQIATAIEEAGMALKRQTVYNNLIALMKIGLVQRKMITQPKTGRTVGAYVLAANKTEGERQKLKVELALTCRVCGRVKIAGDSELTNYLRRHRFPGFETIGGSAHIEMSCLCNQCLRSAAEMRQKKQQKTK